MKKLLTVALVMAMSSISISSFASTNLKCESLITKSLKLFVSLSDQEDGNGASVGLGSSVDPGRALTGSYTVLIGKPNTRLAGSKITTILTSGSIQGKGPIIAKVVIYSSTDSDTVGYANAQIGTNDFQGVFDPFETIRLNCKSLN